MEYSQYMTIVEKAHKTFMEDFHQEKIAIKLTKRKNIYLKLKRESSMDLTKVSDLPKLRGTMSTSHDDLGVKYTRPEYKPESGDSFVLLNCDEKFESSPGLVNDGFNPFIHGLGKNPKEIALSLSPNKHIGEQTKESSSPSKQRNKKHLYKKFIYYDDNGNAIY